MEVQIGLIIQPCMASKKQFQIFLLYQNCDCQESLDYPALEKAGHLLSDESNREKGDMLSVQVKSLNSMEKKNPPLSFTVVREHVSLQAGMHIICCNLWLIHFEYLELKVSH